MTTMANIIVKLQYLRLKESDKNKQLQAENERLRAVIAQQIAKVLDEAQIKPPLKPQTWKKIDQILLDELNMAEIPTEERPTLDELNFIKAFWRAEPSCLHLTCNAECNPMTTHCGRSDEAIAATVKIS